MTLNSPFTQWYGDHAHGRAPVLTGVRVNLDRLFPQEPGAVRHVIETGLDLSGTVRGNLHGRFPGVDGRWLGVVNYTVSYASGDRPPLELFDQLVPFDVLVKRA